MAVVLAGAAVAVALLSLGMPVGAGRLNSLFPYVQLYEHAPGRDGLRTPGRLMTLTTLALALLAGIGSERVVGRIGNRSSRGRATTLIAATAVLVAALSVEGFGTRPTFAIPAAPADALAVPEPQLHLPTTAHRDPLYLAWSTGRFPSIANGGTSFDPAALTRLRDVVATFPDARSVAWLVALGVRSVVLHPRLAADTPWANAGARSIRGLDVSRRPLSGGSVLYELAR